MSKRREKGVCQEKNWRTGATVWYYREGQGKRVRLPGLFGSPEFNAALIAAKRSALGVGGPAPVKGKLAPQDPASFAWLVEKFLASEGQRAMSEITQKTRRNVLRRIAVNCGSTAFRELTDTDIRTLRDQIASGGKPAMANCAVAILRVMFGWAVEEAKLLERNPCLGVKAMKYQGGTNYVWTDEDMAKFEEAYPLGTRERLAYALLLYSGQRSGDVVNMGRQHIKDGWLSTPRQGKTGKSAAVPVLPVLAEAIASLPTGNLSFLVGDDGAPLQVSSFGRWFRAACDRAGVPECTPHGLRHAGATRLAARGAKASTLVCIYGFTLAMAERYTRTAEHKRTALEDIHLLNHVA
jgi:integrase